MSNNQIEYGTLRKYMNAANTRVLRYTGEVSHKGLNEFKLISAPDQSSLQMKMDAQEEKWNEKWNKIVEKRKTLEEKEANLEEARFKTEEAVEELENINTLLVDSLDIDHTVEWDNLKQNEEFPENKPNKPILSNKDEHKSEPSKGILKLNLFDKMFKKRKEKKTLEFEENYQLRIKEWEDENKKIDGHNAWLENNDKEEFKKWKEKVKEWENRKAQFLEEQDKYNTNIDQQKEKYIKKNETEVIEYCRMILENSDYTINFEKNFELEYNPQNEILIVEYQMPSIDKFPDIKEVKYVASRKEMSVSKISDSQMNKMFDEALYKITLRSMYELYQSDKANALKAISFNGWVKAINKATGKEENNCILSIQVSKDEFQEINLSNVDPKACFKSFKGISSSKLSALTPVQPIMQISREDKRFVESYGVTDEIDNSTNLAAMDWEDFEHLIRELFEKEFMTNGGEVKVTQASRDGGVDAIAFDPDPIRGGKIVIQAKRYTNTVGVSAVRDLYGTVMNEGATKGILVTTADYGPDAYSFAKDKPLTLLNGGNLLHLLEKHGHHAKIDIKEAKKILAEIEK